MYMLSTPKAINKVMETKTAPLNVTKYIHEIALDFLTYKQIFAVERDEEDEMRVFDAI